MSFIERQIILTITLQARQGAPEKNLAANPSPTFTGTNSTTVKIVGGGPAVQNGLRIAAKIANAGAPSLSEAVVQIYNLPLSLINQISTLGVQFIQEVGLNSITIEAGDAGSQPTKIFSGTINSAYADFSGAPDSIFNIQAQTLGFLGVAPAAPASFAGSSSVATIMANLASQAGLTFINNFHGGAAPFVSNSYLSGSLTNQIRSIAQHGGVAWDVDGAKGTLTIGPKNGTLSVPGAPVPVIGPPPTGTMVGYPAYTQTGIKVKTEFVTGIGYGTTVEVKDSSVQPANGRWVVYYLDHDLECQAANGPWFTNIEMRSFSTPQPLPAPGSP